jgi:hypothetical protein
LPSGKAKSGAGKLSLGLVMTSQKGEYGPVIFHISFEIFQVQVFKTRNSEKWKSVK